MLQRHLKIIKDKQDFVKKNKENRHQKKINVADDIFHKDGMWTTTERVELARIEKNTEEIRKND